MNITDLKKPIEFSATLKGNELKFKSTWGLFSPKQVDEGTRLLLDHMEVRPTDVALDLGCGYGPLGLAVAKLTPQGEVHLVDKDFVAVDYSAQNAKLNGLSNVKCYLSNGFDQIPDGQKFDLIVSNLPAKVSGELFDIIFNDAHAHLNPGGRFYVVTIAGLKDYIKRMCNEHFGNYEKLKQSKTYITAVAIKQ